MTRGPTAILVEDEAPQRRELRAMLEKLWPELEILKECEDGFEAIECLAAVRPDFVFLDIRMPGISGLEVARRIDASTQIVFTTAYDEFAVHAFETGAADYLLKPIHPDRLAATVARLRTRQSPSLIDVQALVEAMAGRLAPANAMRWIAAGMGDTVRMISIDDVLLFQAQDKYTRVATASMSAHIRTTLKDIMLQLDPECFWRVHRNAIVRVSAIRHVKPDDDGHLSIWLEGIPDPIRVSDAFRGRFRAM